MYENVQCFYTPKCEIIGIIGNTTEFSVCERNCKCQ